MYILAAQIIKLYKNVGLYLFLCLRKVLSIVQKCVAVSGKYDIKTAAGTANVSFANTMAQTLQDATDNNYKVRLLLKQAQ